jgi:hypothetical protein
MADERAEMRTREAAAMSDEPRDAIITCHWHPKVETALRCYQCDTPICVKCARRTPVGYICPDCQRGRKRRFEQARSTDYLLAAVTAVVLGGLASILPLLGRWWFILFLSPLAGAAIAEIVWRAVGRRHGQHLWWIVCVGICIGALPVLGIELLQILTVFRGQLWGLQGLLTWGLHIILAAGAATARLRLS